MAWEQRGQRRYYYRKRRRSGRIGSEYVGSGPIAEMLASIEATERLEAQQRRAQEQAALQQERSPIEAVERDLERFASMVEGLTRAVLYLNGYHSHKRQWRRKRGTKTVTA